MALDQRHRCLSAEPGRDVWEAVVVACCPPLLFQNREVKLVAPPALKPLVLHEVCLLPHPEPGCKASRTVIVGINPGHDAVKSEIVERKMQDPVRGLGRVPLAREGRIEDIADL